MLFRSNKGQDVRSIALHIMATGFREMQDGTAFVVAPPPIQGIGNASGFQMQIEQRDGSFDLNKLQTATDAVVAMAKTQSSITNPVTTFRASMPHIAVEVDRTKAEALKVQVGDVFDTLSSYVGSTYVNRFNKFGQSLQVYVQADSQYRARPDEILKLYVRSSDNKMVPIGALATLKPAQGAPIVQLYNLYPATSIVGTPSPGFSSGEALDLMEQIGAVALPPGTTYEWTAMSYQEKVAGNLIIYIFALGVTLVYLCLAGQYESWIAPLSVILAVPLSLTGPAIALSAVGLPNNLYTQIGIMLLVALSAKNAILIVEVAREERLLHGKGIVESAVGAAVTRFRPILMTSFAFILGVVPLVLATGAYEQALPVPGWTLPGVMTVGGLQTLARSYRVAPGDRIVVAGNGPLCLQTAVELIEGGANVVAVLEAAKKPGLGQWRDLLGAASPLLLEGLGMVARLGGRLHWNRRVTRLIGEDRVRAVEAGDLRLDADIVALNYGFASSSELARALGCAHRFVPRGNGSDRRVRADSEYGVQPPAGDGVGPRASRAAGLARLGMTNWRATRRLGQLQPECEALGGDFRTERTGKNRTDGPLVWGSVETGGTRIPRQASGGRGKQASGAGCRRPQFSRPTGTASSACHGDCNPL